MGPAVVLKGRTMARQGCGRWKKRRWEGEKVRKKAGLRDEATGRGGEREVLKVECGMRSKMKVGSTGKAETRRWGDRKRRLNGQEIL